MPSSDQPSPTGAQLAYLRSLSGSRGVRFAAPSCRTAASAQIAALKAMPAGALGRRLEREFQPDATSMGVLAPFHDDDIEGYGASARWR